jgi:hypothetical protein
MSSNKDNFTSTLRLVIRWHKAQESRQDDGYAMVLVSIMAILIFSLLSVYLFSTNLYKSSANAIVDGSSTFYAAETGMNKRAAQAYEKFSGFSQPVGTAPTGASPAERMQNCIVGTADKQGTGDYACTSTDFDYYQQTESGDGNIQAARKKSKDDVGSKYTAYTFIQQNPRNVATYPESKRIPTGEPFAGLNAIEYSYRVYSTAVKRNNSSDDSLGVGAQTLLQIDYNNRVIPLFQFAAFYEQDLEITSSANMSLSGPIHSNSNVYFAPGGNLRAGQTTAARKKDSSNNWIGGKIYKSLDRVAIHSYLTPGRSVILGSNPAIDVIPAWTTANTMVTATEIDSSNGLLQPDAPQLTIPDVGFLSRAGNYYTKADLRVEFDPSNTAQPFGVQSIQSGTSTTFSPQMVKNLQQPVMLVTKTHSGDNRATEWGNLCAGASANFTSAPIVNTNTWSGLSATDATAATIASDALRKAIAKSDTLFTFTQLNNSAMNSPELSSLSTLFQTELSSTSLTAAQKAALIGSITPRAIANKAGNCFLPPPMQILTGQKDRQENRDMTILQSNIHSLTIWNRDGQYSNDGTNVLDATNKVFARKPDIDAAHVSAGSIPVGSYEWMGLAASDMTEAGLVWHFSMNTALTYTAGQSPYGFGFSGGRWLPGPITLASDQVAYIQGDLNNPGGIQPTVLGEEVFISSGGSSVTGASPPFGPVTLSPEENGRQKKPAAVLADAIGVLSNDCVGLNGEMNCFNVTNGNALNTATSTTVNAAFLAGTTNQSGLNNYMRMIENWGGATGTSIFRYRGSFVSLGTPQQLNGTYQYGCSDGIASATCYYNIPNRDFGYDTSFNSVSGLPPLTPQVVYLKQKVFKRDYDSNRS